MKSKNDEVTQRILMLLKIDAKNVFNRIKTRKSEYLEIFALRRTREHFPAIFNNRYQDTSLSELSHCSTDLINSLDQFYSIVEELSWYFYQTQDLPNTVEDYVDRKINRLERVLGTLNLFLDAELGIVGVNPEEVKMEEPVFLESSEDAFSDPWKDDNSQNE
jgi:hypothetical protein